MCRDGTRSQVADRTALMEHRGASAGHRGGVSPSRSSARRPSRTWQRDAEHALDWYASCVHGRVSRRSQFPAARSRSSAARCWPHGVGWAAARPWIVAGAGAAADGCGLRVARADDRRSCPTPDSKLRRVPLASAPRRPPLAGRVPDDTPDRGLAQPRFTLSSRGRPERALPPTAPARRPRAAVRRPSNESSLQDHAGPYPHRTPRRHPCVCTAGAGQGTRPP